MYQSKCIGKIISFGTPEAFAHVKGSCQYPCLEGQVMFYPMGSEVLVVSSVWGLSCSDKCCRRSVLGMHIHEGGCCTGNSEDPFADAGAHYDLGGCPHPYHQGDLPPLFVNNGIAWGAVVASRFCIREIIGKTVIVHQMPDDFMTQPSGNSGARIGCGVIQRCR